MTDKSCVFSTVAKGHDGNDPNLMVMWGRLSFIGIAFLIPMLIQKMTFKSANNMKDK